MAEGPKKERLARRKARKRALDVLFEADLRDLPPSQVLLTYLERIAKPHPEHLGVCEHASSRVSPSTSTGSTS